MLVISVCDHQSSLRCIAMDYQTGALVLAGFLVTMYAAANTRDDGFSIEPRRQFFGLAQEHVSYLDGFVTLLVIDWHH